MPVGNVLVGDARSNIKHDNTTLAYVVRFDVDVFIP
jgi:hypothetical protein